MAEQAELTPRWQFSVIPVWVLGAVGVTLSMFQAEPIQWLAVVLVVGILASFLAQLATRRPAGFLDRVRMSVSGVVALAALGGVVSLFLG